MQAPLRKPEPSLTMGGKTPTPELQPGTIFGAGVLVGIVVVIFTIVVAFVGAGMGALYGKLVGYSGMQLWFSVLSVTVFLWAVARVTKL